MAKRPIGEVTQALDVLLDFMSNAPSYDSELVEARAVNKIARGLVQAANETTGVVTLFSLLDARFEQNLKQQLSDAMIINGYLIATVSIDKDECVSVRLANVGRAHQERYFESVANFLEVYTECELCSRVRFCQVNECTAYKTDTSLYEMVLPSIVEIEVSNSGDVLLPFDIAPAVEHVVVRLNEGREHIHIWYTWLGRHFPNIKSMRLELGRDAVPKDVAEYMSYSAGEGSIHNSGAATAVIEKRLADALTADDEWAAYFREQRFVADAETGDMVWRYW
jgi:hypothetical protein